MGFPAALFVSIAFASVISSVYLLASRLKPTLEPIPFQLGSEICQAGVLQPGVNASSSTTECSTLKFSTRYQTICKDNKKWQVYPLLLTGMPGSGLEASEGWFQHFGMPLATESSAPTSIGSVNWVLAYNDYENYPESAKNETRLARFQHVVLQVRSPLAHIAERALFRVDKFTQLHLVRYPPAGILPDERLTRALYFYVTWHEHLLRVAQSIVRVEDLDLPAVCVRAGLQSCPNDEEGLHVWKMFQAALSSKLNGPITCSNFTASGTNVCAAQYPRVTTTWAELYRLSPDMAKRAASIAQRLGYCAADALGASSTKFKDSFTQPPVDVDFVPYSLKNTPKHLRPIGMYGFRVREHQQVLFTSHRTGAAAQQRVNGAAVQLEPASTSVFSSEVAGAGGRGTCILTVPEWLRHKSTPLFILYAVSSDGSEISIASSNTEAGPYEARTSSVIRRADVPMCGGALDNVHVVADKLNNRVILYFTCEHCQASSATTCPFGGRIVFAATSPDGISSFKLQPGPLCKHSSGVAQMESWFYHFCGNEIFVSADGVTGLQFIGRTWSFNASPIYVESSRSMLLFWAADNGDVKAAQFDFQHHDRTEPAPAFMWNTFQHEITVTTPAKLGSTLAVFVGTILALDRGDMTPAGERQSFLRPIHILVSEVLEGAAQRSHVIHYLATTLACLHTAPVFYAYELDKGFKYPRPMPFSNGSFWLTYQFTDTASTGTPCLGIARVDNMNSSLANG